MHIIASMRGYVEVPCLLEINIRDQKIERVIELRSSHPLDNIPDSKRGISGIQFYNGLIYAATWNAIYIVCPTDSKVLEIITNRCFSDLHGLYVDQCGTIWVASTNLDGIYVVKDGIVEPFWHTWEERRLGTPLSLDDQDYRYLTKEKSIYHRYHVNGVYTSDNHVFVSYLGNPSQTTHFRKLLRKLKLTNHRYHDGGLFILDRKTRHLIRNIKTEGLHDACVERNKFLYFPEYFGNGLIRLDIQRLTTKRLSLQISPYKVWGYLNRGILLAENVFWIGHTLHRGWMKEDTCALIRSYTRDGNWTGEEISLPGFVGVYSIIKKEQSPFEKAGTQSFLSK